MPQHKIIFSGPVGAGKTSAIAAISDIVPTSTDVRATDDTADVKPTTTIAMDYGLLRLGADECVHLYGTPGQERFGFMREILAEGAIGLILLVTNTRATPLTDLSAFLASFDTLIRRTHLAVGVTGTDRQRHPALTEYRRILTDAGISAPLFEIDARRRHDVALLIQALLLSIDPGIAVRHPPAGGAGARRDYW